MRTIGLGVVALVCAVAPARADVSSTLQLRTMAAANFETVSDDGCFVTTGELAGMRSTAEGMQAIVAGQRVDYCSGDEPVVRAFLSGGPVTFSGGLVFARLQGTIELVPYSGPDSTPILLEVDLRFFGTGPITTHTEHYTSDEDGFTLSFTTTRERAATVTGSISADGDEGSATNGRLGSETSGQLVIH